ncbi:LLM class F420-dependent oxidoreductase [Aciditerrimonas ferrireducens]|uniref:LLM class F420-dependent oxidoreductase n=1 Tax=Aciditerrimonas ferrireducens TaxID=667306 RepID=A0ABV6C4N9_9ACTN
MRFSVWPTTGQSWEDLLACAQDAEELGYQGVWVADHFMPAGGDLARPTLECWAVLAGLAVAVPRVRLGSLVCSVTYRHPAVLANQAASVDQLSGGRLVLGIGAGWQENEHRAYGIDFPDAQERLERLEEACQVLRLLLDQPRADFHGRHYRLVDAPSEPKPRQAHLPLLVGGGGERRTLRIVARCADEWNTWGTPEVLAAKGAVLDAHCEALGRDPASIRRSAQVLVDLGGRSPTDGRMPTVTGSASELQDLLARYEAAGVGEFVLPDWNLGRGSRRRDALAEFFEEVARPFAERAG